MGLWGWIRGPGGKSGRVLGGECRPQEQLGWAHCVNVSGRLYAMGDVQGGKIWAGGFNEL